MTLQEQIIAKQKELIELLDDMNYSTTVDKSLWIKRKELYNQLAALEAKRDNTSQVEAKEVKSAEKWFYNNFDCYADSDRDVIPAMTKETFLKYANQFKDMKPELSRKLDEELRAKQKAEQSVPEELTEQEKEDYAFACDRPDFIEPIQLPKEQELTDL